MQKTLKTFFIFSLLLIFISNVGGVSVCLDHATHLTTKTIEKKHAKGDKAASFSQDDECQCALHFQMNNVLLPDFALPDFNVSEKPTNKFLQQKAKTYRCLLDYFSSRAPPVLF
ncbi:hypothetical protein [Chryseobacterium salviniae]|uniref:Uncharacterized protein n=1 Tax=Chryseobacterium salviniae TaxID=3101750 RepID=A0ABU6HMT4_9FLAO|nr:hypothetical protein [Chryseobacterium sp. T9W2-O]MEC3874344.1 hypothetical protein [Chryseobacterium sp. T9W2-O]